ncbi:hypothetical protein [Arthrobacter sp.]|uniref:hypothetical protein n=1 Tax=Arthrobacter sp. TaxID=1667 RepID=UPI003398218B
MNQGQNASPIPASWRPGADAQQRSEALKERVYVTFTALAVTIAFERDVEHATIEGAALTLLLTVAGTLLAVFVADVIAHMVRTNVLPSRKELAHLTYVSFGSLGVLLAPMAILGLTALGVIERAPALRIISVALVATLIVVTLFAVRRLRVKPWLKLLVLAIMTALGLAVLAIELAVH